MSIGVLLSVFVLRSELLLLRLNVFTANSLPWVWPRRFSFIIIVIIVIIVVVVVIFTVIPFSVCGKRSVLEMIVWLGCLLYGIVSVVVTDVCETI